MKRLFSLLLLTVCLVSNAQSWQKQWRVESESSQYKVIQNGGDTLEIVSPRGLTLWNVSPLRGDVTVEFDAQVVVACSDDRLSDLNTFFMASDPKAKNVWTNMSVRNGAFSQQTSLQMYYLGYGGNYNTTTRFRRYAGNGQQPPIIKEYKDSSHLLQPNHWYHVKIEKVGNRLRYFFDGECIVDYVDAKPLKQGWFGFRTTLSHTRIANFHTYKSSLSDVSLHWVGNVPDVAMPVTFGVPFAKGEVTAKSLHNYGICNIPVDSWINARWQDGSVKWAGFSALIPKGVNVTTLRAGYGKHVKHKLVNISRNGIVVNTGDMEVLFPRHGNSFMDYIRYKGIKVADMGRVVASTSLSSYKSVIDTSYIENNGDVRAVIRVNGHMVGDKESSMTLPFTLRFYLYYGSEQIKIQHSFVYDGNQNRDFIKSLGLQFDVPFRETVYNRHIAFSFDKDSVWAEPVQPLDGRRELSREHNYLSDQMNGLRIPEYATFDEEQKKLLDDWAVWDGFRLSQLNDGSFTIRKRATGKSPWIGTFTGTKSYGLAYVGDVSGGLSATLKDFWQSYPSTLQIDSARTNVARMTVWLWSPEAEPMDLRHYDDRAHGLESSYEDVQKGMSEPYGIGRTSTITLRPYSSYPGKQCLKQYAVVSADDAQLLPAPEYLHDKKAFGIWSLPSQSKDSLTSVVENKLNWWIETYKKAIADSHWYGFWNYGDVMHAYSPERSVWRYDVGGYAWDNTELASPDWLWYSFLRTGRADIWKMAEAMTRHNSEVDVYHLGDMKGLGSRHNVSHWGCGAKEARISQSAFDRFLYYLTSDERLGDIMHDETDADMMLYHIDPMRLAEPRSEYPCTAPARLRFGPDWLAYAGNWMTEWERTGNTKYRDKIIAGLKSISSLPDGIFTGNLAKGYDPATGIISYEGDVNMKKTNHLMTIMGGFEVMNELRQMIKVPAFEHRWLDFACRYKAMAAINHNHFPVRRLQAFAAYSLNDKVMRNAAWNSLLKDIDYFSTNDASLWSLDAIYMLEVIPEK